MSRVTAFLRKHAEHFAFDEVSSRPLGLVRILVATDILFEFVSPWVSHRVDGNTGLLVATWVVFLANWFVLFGLKTRWATIVWMLSFGLIHLYYGRHLGLHNMQQPVQIFHLITILTITPSGRSLSIDRALEVRRADEQGIAPPPELTPNWAYDLIAIQVSAIYLWAGLDKIDAAWLAGERMEHYWLYWYGSSDTLMLHPRGHYVAVLFAWATTVIELALAFGLLFRRTRAWVAPLGFVLHLGIMFTLAITYFSMMMMTSCFACLPPQWFHNFVSRIGRDSNTA